MCLLDLIYPRKCAFCHKKMGKEKGWFCSACRNSLPYSREINRKIPFVDECRSVLYYENDVRESLHRYKFGGLSMYADVYGELLMHSLGDYISSADVISYVPLSRQRLRSRGYDQARLLAEYLAKASGKRCIPVLKKQRNTAPQSGTGGAEERKKNIKGAYIPVNREEVQGLTVLLTDDIVTTGSTVSECAAVLKTAGAKRVHAVTVAQKRT